MYHVTYSDKDLLLGDEVAELLVRYAALLGRVKSADEVAVHAISGDGDDVKALFLLNGGVALMAESAHSSLPEPDNAEAIEYMTAKIANAEEFDLTAFDNED